MTETAPPPQLSTELAKLFQEMDTIERHRAVESVPQCLDTVTTALRQVAATTDRRLSFALRNNSHFQQLGLSSISSIANFTDRQLHHKILNFLQMQGVATDGQQQAIIEYFEGKDQSARRATLESYAQHGIVSLRTAQQLGIVLETSSTPGDFISAAELAQAEDLESQRDVRGYVLATIPVDKTMFYGRNSFFTIALEKAAEEIDRASQLEKSEVENRLRNSILFVVRASSVAADLVIQTKTTEDVVGRDVLPSELAYVLVDKENLALARDVFSSQPCKVIGVERTEADLVGLYEGPYTLPNYLSAVNEIIQQVDAVWCHIARLRVNTYGVFN
jgi:hypothetical protein